MEWSCGIITVFARRLSGHLINTIQTLSGCGFADGLHIFPDVHRGNTNATSIPGLLGAFGNWWMSAAELYIRSPHADRYAIFQDDILCVSNLRQYLEATTTHDRAYWNLCAYPENVNPEVTGWQPAVSGCGLGAQALVFTNEGLRTVLSNRMFVDHPRDKFRGKEAIDGLVKTAMKEAGYTEYVHNPTLVNHVGEESTIGHNPQPPSFGWLGEEWDPMSIYSGGALR